MNRVVLMIIRNFWKVPWAWQKLCHYAKHTHEYGEEEKYGHIQYILQTAVNSGNIDLKVYGQENIPKENGFMLYANHQGLFDIVAVVATCDRPIGVVMKKELYRIPFLKQLADCSFSFPMDREDMRQSLSVICDVIEEVKKGRNYLIFPEGTRSRQGNQMSAFHGGSFKCAVKTKCPVVPVAMVDAYKVFDQKGCKWVEAQIHYLPPICYEEYQGMSAVQLAEMVQARIREAIHEAGVLDCSQFGHKIETKHKQIKYKIE